MSLHSRSGRSSSRSGFVCSFEKLRVRQESLSGNSKTVMIAALSPALSNLDETLSTVKFVGSSECLLASGHTMPAALAAVQGLDLMGLIRLLHSFACSSTHAARNVDPADAKAQTCKNVATKAVRNQASRDVSHSLRVSCGVPMKASFSRHWH